jgi:hypothetical protein
MRGSRFGAEKGHTGVPIYNLPLDLGRIDGVGRIGGADDSVNFDLVSARDEEFRRCRDVGVERLHVREPAVDALRRGLAPTDFLTNGPLRKGR